METIVDRAIQIDVSFCVCGEWDWADGKGNDL